MLGDHVEDSLRNTGHIFSPALKKMLKEAIMGDVFIFENAFATGPDDNGTYWQIIKLIVDDELKPIPVKQTHITQF